ncbi:MAG: hypothetical protein ACQESE_05200 [Nanobdellota archaeon]
MANNDGNNNFAMLAMVAIVAVVGVFGLVFMNSGNQGAIIVPSDSVDANAAGQGFANLQMAYSEGVGDDYDTKAKCELNCPNLCGQMGDKWTCIR